MAMIQLPAGFDSRGLLPAGTYAATLTELRASLLVSGPPDPPQAWDGAWRLYLVGELELLAGDLWTVGIDRIFIDGSFVTEKPRPGDIDGYFVVDFSKFVHQSTQLRGLREAWDLHAREAEAAPLAQAPSRALPRIRSAVSSLLRSRGPRHY